MFYKMCVHIFGGTSSPSCCNFALRRTPTDVGDLLKSKSHVQSSVALIVKLGKSERKEAFVLSNLSATASKIPESVRQKGVKDCDLALTKLPFDLALECALVHRE